MPAHNLELKVRCTPEQLLLARGLAWEGGAKPLPPMTQRDTYFPVLDGRLKLREIAQEGHPPTAELVAYGRPDLAGSRWSSYERAPVEPATAAGLIAALRVALGPGPVVEKRREAWLLERTRIHLDDVTGLGTFIELETVADGPDDPTAAPELDRIAALLRLGEGEVVAGGYADLLAGG